MINLYARCKLCAGLALFVKALGFGKIQYRCTLYDCVFSKPVE